MDKPEHLMGRVGPVADWDGVAPEFVSYMAKYCDMKPASNILDIGCGCGRIAGYFDGYDEYNGTYYGFDIDKEQIDYLNANIKRKNFKFEHSDSFNRDYTRFVPNWTTFANDYKFPGKDIDICLLTSVFSHLIYPEIRHYISEMSRVMKKGGYVLLTAYITEGINAYEGTESRMVYEKGFFEKLLIPFKIVHYFPGKWKDPNGLSFQDIYILRK
jgi:cyclopropane fatty-acyl-phospholipid synthase-like methyltransferase